MASRKTRRVRATRNVSNVFAMLDQEQIQEFKEAFNFIDQDHNGFIDSTDLHKVFASLGKDVTDNFCEKMIAEAPEKINFTMFLTMFGEKLIGTDPEAVLKSAFLCFDERHTGYIKEDHFRKILTTMGDCFTKAQVDDFFTDAPIVDGKFYYPEFIRMLKSGVKKEDEKTKI